MADYDYTTAGFNEFFERGEVEEEQETEDVASFKTPQVPASSLTGSVSEDNIVKTMNDLVRITGLTTSSYVGLPTGYTLITRSTLRDSSYPDRTLLGVCEITPYLTTLGSGGARIYASDTYVMDNHYDLHYNYTTTPEQNGKSLTHINTIHNDSGSTQNIYFYIRWRFIGTNTAGT